MNLTLAFSRKYRWPEHYFSIKCLGNYEKSLTITNQFLVSIIFFTNTNISFFNLSLDLLSIIAKKSIKSGTISLYCSWPCFRVLLCTHYGPLQCFSTYFCKLKEIGVLRPIFPDYVIYCDYVLINNVFG